MKKLFHETKNRMESEQEVEYPAWNWKWPDEGIGVDGFQEDDEDEEEMFTGDGLNMEHHWAPSFPVDLDSDLAKTVVGNDCDCPGLPPPPRFALPPPPVPYTSSSASSCQVDDDGTHNNNNALSELEYCDVQVMEGPYTQAVIPSIAVIVVCSFIILVMILVASLIFWRHKRKMQNFLPCKTSPTNHCDLNAGGSTVLYEDLTNIRPRNLANHCNLNQTVAPMELLDVKCSNYGGAGFTPVGDTAFMYPSTPNSNNFVATNLNHVTKNGHRTTKDSFNSAYEEICASSDGGCEVHGVTSAVDSDPETEAEEEDVAVASSGSSEGELAGDELSLVDYPCQRTEDFKCPSSQPEVNGGGSRHCSETSSLRGSTGDDLCRDFDDSLCGDEAGEHGRRNHCHRVHPHPNSGGLFGGVGGVGQTHISTDPRKRRRGKVRNNGVDLIRVPCVSGKPVEVLCQVPQYHSASLSRQPIEVNGMVYSPDEGYGENVGAVLANHSPWLPRSCSSGTGGIPWRGTPESRHRGPMHEEDYETVDDRGGEMVLVIPPPPFNTAGHMQRSTSSHNQQQLPLMTELNVPKLSLPYHRPNSRANNAIYRDGGGNGRRVPPQLPPTDESYCDVMRRPGGATGTWDGPETVAGVQRKSDPHERTIGEFNSFRPRRHPRDMYGFTSQVPYLLNNGPMVGAGQRNSCSDGSKGSNTSVERLLAADAAAYHHPYHQPHIANISNQQFSPNFDSSRRITLPNQARSKKKQTADMLDSASNRTVLT